MEAKTIIKDYAETYRLSLFEFVKNTKVKGEKTLKNLLNQNQMNYKKKWIKSQQMRKI